MSEIITLEALVGSTTFEIITLPTCSKVDNDSKPIETVDGSITLLVGPITVKKGVEDDWKTVGDKEDGIASILVMITLLVEVTTGDMLCSCNNDEEGTSRVLAVSELIIELGTVIKKVVPRLSSSDVNNEIVLVGSTVGERAVGICDEATSVLVGMTMSKLELCVGLTPTRLTDGSMTGDDDTALILCDNKTELVARSVKKVDDDCPVIDVIVGANGEVCTTIELTRVGVAVTAASKLDKEKDNCTGLDSAATELINVSKPVALLKVPTTNVDVVVGNGVGNILLVSNVAKPSVVVLIRTDCDGLVPLESRTTEVEGNINVVSTGLTDELVGVLTI